MIIKNSKSIEDKRRYFRLVVNGPCGLDTSIIPAVSPKLRCVTKRAARDRAWTKSRPRVDDDIGAIECVGPRTIEKFGSQGIYKGEGLL